MRISSRNIFIFCISLPFVLSSRYGRGDQYQLTCLNIDCSHQYVDTCCSARHQGVGRSLQPLANWRFGSIFRNSIPPVRPYKVPSFEEIFETDHSASRTEPDNTSPHQAQNLSPGGVGKLQTPAAQQNMFQFSNLLNENNRNSLNNNNPGVGVSEIFSKLSKHQALHEAFFETTTKPYTTSTRSYEELRKLKLIELAKEELKKKQQMKGQYIRAQQKKNEFLKIMRQQQQQQEQKQIEQMKKEPRSQDLDNFFSKVKDFDNTKTALKEKLNHELIKRYHDKLIKKSNQDKLYSEKLQRWKQQEKKPETSAKWSKINGQNYVDMSDGTIIMDNDDPEKPQVSSQSQQALHGSSQSQQLQHGQSHQASVTRPSEITRETIKTPAPTKSPMYQDHIKHEDISENETENIVKDATKTSKNDEAEVFTEELCDKLRVPCRFVTEHPCCQLPQVIGMVGRPRAMDGSADLKWRFYQSRGHTRGGQMPARGRGKGDGRMLPGFSAGYNSNIPYNSWSSARDIRVPRYFYDGGPDLTSTILSQCWRLIYINCLQDRDHPCCGLTNRSDRLANNVIDRWLRRY